MNNRRSAAARHQNRLALVLAFTSAYMLVEAAGGLLTGSLALLADAAHMLADVFGLGLALFAIWLSQRPASRERTYGYYRTEILAALANAVVLFGISAIILYEAYRRLQQPPEVHSLPMLAVATVGLFVNLAGASLLRGGSQESLNVRGAFLHVVGDLLGSLAVIVAALIMFTTGWYYADPIFSVLIGLFIIPRTWQLLREAVGVLLEGTPPHIDLPELERTLTEVRGVHRLHDLHVWTITSGFDAMSGHVVLERPEEGHRVLDELRRLLLDRFGIRHVTVQLEHDGQEACEEQSCMTPCPPPNDTQVRS